MKQMLILLLLFLEKVEVTLTHEECSQFPSVKHAFVPDEYKKVQYQIGDVIYFSCDPGYTTGFNTTYICTENGWGAVHYGQCVEKGTFSLLLGCTRPPALKNGYVLNNPSYFYAHGDKARYQCDHLYDLEGRPVKICSNGQWIGDLQCLNTSCPKPPFDHFQVEGDKMVYKKDEVLRYSCDHGYKKVDGRPSLCKKVGQSAQWTPTPQCEVITCKLSPDPPAGTTYDPLNQIVFSPGQSVRVSCGETQWVKDRELQSAELTCQDTGHWDFDPVCQLVTCSKTAENVYSWQSTRYNTFVIDQYLGYQCHSGYEKTSSSAKCTRRGWEPNPLCKDRGCTKPLHKNAEITDNYQKDKYQHNERVHFKCTYDPGVTFHVDCYYGDWRGSRPTCKEKPCTTQPHIESGEMLSVMKTVYDHGESLQFRCEGETTNSSVTCQSGEWKTDKSCHVHNTDHGITASLPQD